jgi:hypothetical protein
MDPRETPSVRNLFRSVAFGATLALYMTAAFGLVPALGSAEGASATGTASAAEGILVAIGLMVVTLGTAVARWMREEQPAP